jgi:hypothetical protein
MCKFDSLEGMSHREQITHLQEQIDKRDKEIKLLKTRLAGSITKKYWKKIYDQLKNKE